MFFREVCLPSVVDNRPAEIILEDGPGNACEKRNSGALKASQPFLLFVDDDAKLRPECISTMLSALEADAGAAFAYSDTEMILYPGIEYPLPPGRRNSQTWNPGTIIWGNYVETTSLVRRHVFPGFDPAIRRFQDWDVWLRMSKDGRRGTYIHEVLFELHHFDVGITASVPFKEALQAIKTKHNLP